MRRKYLALLLFTLSIAFLVVIIPHTFRQTFELHCSLFFSNGTVLDDVPLATTPSQHHQGLSEKNSAGAGMLFLFSKPRHLHFWMRNTHVPLSIGFFSAEGVLIQIEDMQPDTDDDHASLQLALMALELQQGGFRKEDLKVGDRLVWKKCLKGKRYKT